jgi:hypothetical protein
MSNIYMQVSKVPLQLYVDLVTGALRYCALGPLPQNTVAISFYKTDDNPSDLVGPSPAYLSWPSTKGAYIGSLNYQPP